MMNFPSSFFSGDFDQQPHLNNYHQMNVRKTDYDSSELNDAMNELPSNQQYDIDSELMNARAMLRNSSQQTIPSLVDAVRERNFQEYLNLSPLLGSTAYQNDLNVGMLGLGVDGLSCGSVYSPKMTQMPTALSSNKSEHSPSMFIDSTKHMNGSFYRNIVPESNHSSEMRNLHKNQYLSSLSFNADSNSFSSNTSSETSSFGDCASANTPSTKIIRNQHLSLLSDHGSSASSNNSNSQQLPSDLSSNFNPNLSSYNNSLFNTQVSEQLKMLNCISQLSKEELNYVLNMIQEVMQSHTNTSPTTKKQHGNANQSPSRTFQNEVQTSLSTDELLQNSMGSVGRSSLSSQRNNTPYQTQGNGSNAILEQEARHHHSAAVLGNVEARITWRGDLPKHSHQAPFSNKVFIGGLPYQASEDKLISTFSIFGNLIVEWPGKERGEQPKGYVYITYENEFQVKLLLKSCREFEGNMFYQIRLRKSKLKEVQVIPWSTMDSSYVPSGVFLKVDPKKTVYVGALHGTMNAEALFRIMDDLFGGVTYAGICVDKYKYPTGSGRVCFINNESYMKAVTAGFVNVKTSSFSKIIQIDPFLADSECDICHLQAGPYFCRDCFHYYCPTCWKPYHQMFQLSHKPLMKFRPTHQ